MSTFSVTTSTATGTTALHRLEMVQLFLDNPLVMNNEHGRSAIGKGAKSNTDWDKLRVLPDSDVVFSEDSPETSLEDWADAVAHKGLPVPPRKTQIALRVDTDVLAWFKAQGAGYKTRMNSVLKAFRDAHVHDTKAQQ